MHMDTIVIDTKRSNDYYNKRRPMVLNIKSQYCSNANSTRTTVDRSRPRVLI